VKRFALLLPYLIPLGVLIAALAVGYGLGQLFVH
jgi:hypothetical protein